MITPKVITVRKTKGVNPIENLNKIFGPNGRRALVGVPASSARERKQTLLAIAEGVKGKSEKSTRRKKHILDSAEQDINNAELLFLHTEGSQARKIPARPVLQPSIVADGNRQIVARELAAAAKSAMEGKPDGVTENLKRAGMAGQNAARKWFTDPRNNWAPNSPRTIKEKGSDRPLIDTGALRNAITYVVDE